MIGVVFGTTGELIKLAPVLLALRERDSPPLVMTTAQQAEQIGPFLTGFGLPPVGIWLARGHRGRDLERAWQVPGWAVTVARSVVRERRHIAARLRSDGRPPVLLVHGDTMTTVVGALIARRLHVPSAHIEAGLRSGDWRNPFPEELNRRLAAHLVGTHFAPGPAAAANLVRERVRGPVIDTGGNTVRDAVRLASSIGEPGIAVPGEPFGLVSLHRYELIERADAFRPVLEILHEHSRHQPLLFVDHTVTAAAIARHGFAHFFDERFRRVPRLHHIRVLALLRKSRFIVTDSGGSQEECAFLGHPCLVHRAVSERFDGLGGCVVLTGMDLDVMRSFLADPERFRVAVHEPPTSPTEIILMELERMGAVAPLEVPAPA